MRASLRVIAVALALGAVGSTADAQYVLKPPVFVLQPGLVTTNIFDAPSGTKAQTEFNARVVTVIPTTIERTTLVAIVQFTPFNKNAGFTNNAPSFVFGPVFSIFDVDMFALDFDVLDSYGRAAKASDKADYTHKLVLEGDLFFKLGKMMTTNRKSHFNNLSIYGFLANVTTGLPKGVSKWALLYGVSLPIAP